MRAFNLEDTFKLSEILDKTGIDLDFNGLMDQAKDKGKDGKAQSGADAAAFLGGKLAWLVVKKIHLAKNEIIELIAGLTGDDAQTVKTYGIKKIVDVFTDIFKQDGFQSFFNQAGESSENQ